MANSVDPDQMLHFAAPDLDLCCLLRPVCSSTWGFLHYLKYYDSLASDLGLHCFLHPVSLKYLVGK